jgi:hypothetical protein
MRAAVDIVLLTMVAVLAGCAEGPTLCGTSPGEMCSCNQPVDYFCREHVATDVGAVDEPALDEQCAGGIAEGSGQPGELTTSACPGQAVGRCRHDVGYVAYDYYYLGFAEVLDPATLAWVAQLVCPAQGGTWEPL